MTLLQETLATNMKNLRKINGFSQAKFAELIGVSTNYVALIEVGKKFPSLQVLEKMAEVFSIPSPELFSQKGLPEEDVKNMKKTLISDLQLAFNNYVSQIV